MGHIIAAPTTGSTTYRSALYAWTDCDGAGFSFDVDAADMPIRTEATAHNLDQLAGWIASGELVYKGIDVWVNTWRVGAILRCACGEELELQNFTNACDCGKDYNRSGQLLTDRSQWGEETGEHPADIARIR